MKQTREQILTHYTKLQAKGKHEVVIHDQDELLAIYKTKNTSKAVFITTTLDRDMFKKFCVIKNNLQADKMVVYCEYATYISPSNLEIVLNRDETENIRIR